MPSTPDPLSSARRHPRAARSPRRTARTATSNSSEQLEQAPELLHDLHVQPAHWPFLWPCRPVCVPARPAYAPGESDNAARAGGRLIMPHAAGSSRSGLQSRRGQLRATQHFLDKIALPCLALLCLALPCLALPCLALGSWVVVIITLFQMKRRTRPDTVFEKRESDQTTKLLVRVVLFSARSLPRAPTH